MTCALDAAAARKCGVCIAPDAAACRGFKWAAIDMIVHFAFAVFYDILCL